MRRIDLLKFQLKNSRGRFFTTRYIGPTKLPVDINFKVTSVLRETPTVIEVEAYIPKWENHQKLVFFTNKQGDVEYLASDKSKFNMTGTGLNY